MSFLAPLFLLGAAAVTLPIIYHLIRHTTRERTPFSSLMFLLPTPPRLTRRTRLEHLLLLLLRCMAICFLALGFARPFLKQPTNNRPSPTPAKHLVILVDTSASMRRAGLWADARRQVASILRETAPDDHLAVFTFDRQANALVTFDQWNTTPVSERSALVTQRLAGVTPGWAATHLGTALITAAEALVDAEDGKATGPRRIVLVSDLQEGSRLDQLQGYEWPKGVELYLQPCKARHAGNAGLQLVSDPDNADRLDGAGPRVRVRVSNASDSRREQFQVGWMRAGGNAFLGAPIDVYVPPGQNRVVALALPPAETAVDRITLRGDEEDFDNTAFLVLPEPVRLDVLYLGNDSRKDPRQPLFFLERAFQETRSQAVRLLVRPPSAPFPAAEVETAALLIVTDALADERARALHEQAMAGKTILCVVLNEASARTLARCLGVSSLTATEAPQGGYTMLAEIDFRHPLFAPFADPRYSDFTKIHFWRYRRLDPSAVPAARVVARFDTGDPAILDVPVGKGRVLALTAGWHPGDSQLALSTKFVPLLYCLLELTTDTRPAPTTFQVGDRVPRPADAVRARTALTVQPPDGDPVTLTSGETHFTQTALPGVYRFNFGPVPKRFAVNLDASESRTAPLPLDALEHVGAPLSQDAPAATRQVERKATLPAIELEARQKLWRWLLFATVGVLLLETWLSGRTARRLTAQPEPAL
jgi:hypothetical protein